MMNRIRERVRVTYEHNTTGETFNVSIENVARDGKTFYVHEMGKRVAMTVGTHPEQHTEIDRIHLAESKV